MTTERIEEIKRRHIEIERESLALNTELDLIEAREGFKKLRTEFDALARAFETLSVSDLLPRPEGPFGESVPKVSNRVSRAIPQEVHTVARAVTKLRETVEKACGVDSPAAKPLIDGPVVTSPLMRSGW